MWIFFHTPIYDEMFWTKDDTKWKFSFLENYGWIMGYYDYFVQKKRHEIRVSGLSNIHTYTKALWMFSCGLCGNVTYKYH
jgi:hypothetical protein